MADRIPTPFHSLKGVERNFLALTGPNADLWEALLLFKLLQGPASEDIKGLNQRCL